MKNLILKDFLLLKGNARALPILIICFVFMLFNNVSSISFILPFICTSLCISTFSYDDYNKWDAYAITLPNGRKKIVQSKYMFTILFLLLGTLISVSFTGGIAFFKGTLDWESLLGTMLGGFCGTIFVVSFMYPIIYKYGTEKGRIVTFAGIFIGSLLVGLIIEKLPNLQQNIPTLIHFIEQFWYLVIPVLLLAIVIISYKISEHIYMKKDF